MNRDIKVTVAAKNTCSTIGEGPHWDAASQSVIYVDINAGDIHRYKPTTGEDVKFHLDGTVGFAIPSESGKYVAGLGRQIVLANWGGEDLQVLHEVDLGTTNRLNDGKCDASGRLWAGTMAYETAPGVLERQAGSLYSVDKVLKKHVDKIDISNGLAWSADNSLMYYIDSLPRKIYVFDFNINTGTIENQKVAIDFGSQETVPDLGFPDGMCIDQNGNLWVACYNAGKVTQFDPNTGQRLCSVSVPARRTTSCCFGGEDYEDLYVTTSRVGATEEELASQPLAGSVFRVSDLGIKGTPSKNFTGY